MPNGSAPLFWTASALALSALVTAGAIHYAKHRKLIDEPGMRRSHRVPTPRGGGIGIVVAIIACGLLPAVGAADFPLAIWWLLPPVAGVALVGWIDDHGGLSAGGRFAMHCIAALWIFVLPVALAGGAVFFVPAAWAIGGSAALAIALVFALAAVWSINLHNFMDGIDGILALQTMFVFAVLALLFAWRTPTSSGWQLAIWIAAIAGFVPFNFPRARIFMGDVGSGVLGLLVAVAVAWQMTVPDIAPASGLVACSAFVTDATCTLLSRMWRGRRWYSAHREHLYQWLVRRGYSHARVVAFYLGWNLLIVLPVISWMNRSLLPLSDSDSARTASTGLGAAAAVYALAVAVWCLGKRRCLAEARMRGRHADA